MKASSRLAARLRLASDIFTRLLLVQSMKRKPLPDVVDRLSTPRRRAAARNPVRQGLAIYRIVTLGAVKARCLTMSLVHYSLLTDQGYRPELVIGLPLAPTSPDAHAWVEINGIDVGPPPGKGTSQELTRYPRAG